MKNETALLALIDRIYDSASDPERWPAVLQDVRSLTGLSAEWVPSPSGSAALLAKGAAGATRRNRKVLDILEPHLVRACRIHAKIVEETQPIREHEQFLNQLAVGVILIDQAEAPVFLNPAAERFLRLFNGTASLPGRIALGAGRDTQALRALIHDAVMAGLGKAGTAQGVLHTGSDDPSEQLRIVVTALRRKTHPFAEIDGQVCAMLLLIPAWYPELSAHQILRLDFGFTQAEAGLAGRLLGGETLKKIALDLKLSKETLRVHLRALFRKTGTRRQAELVRLLATHPAALIKSPPN